MEVHRKRQENGLLSHKASGTARDEVKATASTRAPRNRILDGLDGRTLRHGIETNKMARNIRMSNASQPKKIVFSGCTRTRNPSDQRHDRARIRVSVPSCSVISLAGCRFPG